MSMKGCVGLLEQVMLIFMYGAAEAVNFVDHVQTTSTFCVNLVAVGLVLRLESEVFVSWS